MTRSNFTFLILTIVITLLSFDHLNSEGAKPGAANIGKINAAQKSAATKTASAHKSTRRIGFAAHSFDESDYDGHESGNMDKKNLHDKNSTSLYAQELFDLIADADTDNNSIITRKEHHDWSTQLTFSEADAHTQFDGMDKNGDGLVSIEEYFVWVNKFWTSSLPYIQQTFRDADADFSGRVSRTEYIKWHQSFNETSQQDIELDFLDRDRNGDGLITAKDFEMGTFMQAADTDEDGQLSLDEYLRQTMRHLPSTLDVERQKVKEMLDFGEIDTDGDGLVSLQELEEDML